MLRKSMLRAFVGLAAAVVSSSAWAGMANPSSLVEYSTKTLGLNEDARIRYEAISFFLLVLLLSAAAVRWLWNRFARDFPKLPRLGYLQSFTVVALWGLLFLVVLTMIAGARELMTPGTWQKSGLLYRLPDKPAPDAAPAKPQEGAKP